MDISHNGHPWPAVARFCLGKVCRAPISNGSIARRAAAVERPKAGDCAMRLDDLPESSNIEDRRQEGGGGFGGMPGGRGGLGIGTVVVLGLVGWALGIDPRLLIGGAELISGGRNPMQKQAPVRTAPPETPQH